MNLDNIERVSLYRVNVKAGEQRILEHPLKELQ
jgi:hypothetical protein